MGGLSRLIASSVTARWKLTRTFKWLLQPLLELEVGTDACCHYTSNGRAQELAPSSPLACKISTVVI